jgi:hypothetical protein
MKTRYIFAAVLIVLGASQVGAQTNLVVKGNFDNKPGYGSQMQRIAPWTVNLYKSTVDMVRLRLYPTIPGIPTTSADIGGDNWFVMLDCYYDCPKGGTSSLSQNINSLVPGHRYKLSFYANGESLDDKSIFGPTNMNVTFGSQTFPTIDLPSNPGNWPLMWVNKALEFDYTGTSTSAVLSFIQNMSPFIPCVPCSLSLANVSLLDVTPAALPPTLTLQKALGTGGRINNADQFKVSILNATTSAVLGSGSTTGTGSTVSGGLANITGDTATNYKLVEEMLPGSVSNLAQYNATLSCTNANSAGTQFPAGSVSLGQNLPLLAAGDQVSCTLTNTPKAPIVRLTKAVGTGGRNNIADQFTVLIQQRLSTVASGTTSGTGSSISGGTTGWTSLVAGTSYNLNEVMAAGSVSNLAQYNGVVSCSNAWTGSTTAVPTVPGAAFTPTYGDVLDCTLTNTPAPATLTVTQRSVVTAPATFNPSVTFRYTGNNGWTPQQISNTVVNVVTKGVTQNLTALKVPTTLTVALPAAEAGWSIASIRCTDTNAAVSGNPLPPTVLASSTTTSVTIPANYVVAKAALQCAVIGSRLHL